MLRVLSVLLALAVAATPTLAQTGPPPGQTDPLAYAQDYAGQKVANASADPVGHVQGTDPTAEAEHAAWLACWAAYDNVGPALDAVCGRFFQAPVTVDPVADVEGEVHEVLNATGADSLLNQTLDAVNDTLADPTTAVGQLKRIVGAVVAFAKDLVDFVLDVVTFVLDVLGLGGMAIAGGLLGAVQGLLDLLGLGAAGLTLAASGLGTVGELVADLLGLAGSTLAAAGSGALDTLVATLTGIADAAVAAATGLASALEGLASAATSAAGALAGAIGAAASGAASAADTAATSLMDGVQSAAQGLASAVADATEALGRLFEGKDDGEGTRRGTDLDTPRTGTEADGLVDRILDLL